MTDSPGERSPTRKRRAEDSVDPDGGSTGALDDERAKRRREAKKLGSKLFKASKNKDRSDEYSEERPRKKPKERDEPGSSLKEGDAAPPPTEVSAEAPDEEKAKKKEKKDKKDKKHKKKKDKKAATNNPGEPMIIVNVNDRLGTKAAIPCYASDPVRLFKAQVAARIGREPHEIMLKRQGERPFKDQLTLEDYGVSNGVQLDLEMDTGD